jgi:pyruvate kinase
MTIAPTAPTAAAKATQTPASQVYPLEDVATNGFPFARTRTKLIWSVSNHALSRLAPEALALRFAQFGLDAARFTYSVQSAPLIKKFRNALTASMEARGSESAPEGVCPFVMTPLGRRALLVVPGGQKDLAAGDDIEVRLRVDAQAVADVALVDEAGASAHLAILVTSPDMLSGLVEGSRLIVSYQHTELRVDALERRADGELRARAKVLEAATILSGMDVHSADMPRDMFPLIPEDALAFERGFDELADYVVIAGVGTVDELARARRALLGEEARTSKRHPTVGIKDAIRERTSCVPPRLLLKVDSRASLDLLPAVFDDVDGVILSRSELSLTVPAHELPILQKKLIAECNHRAKLVVVASELMYSMRVNPNPTRAEVSDMANAAADGADALFLAEEVTEGPHAELVADVSKETLANSEHLHDANWHRVPFEIANDDDAVAYGALNVAEHAGVKSIVCLTEGGYTALRLSSLRTPVDIIAVTYNHNVMRQLSLLRSVRVLMLDRAPAFDQILEETKKLLARYCGYARGDRFVFVSLTASPIAARNSNLFTLQEVD